jgi:hypothetical protein
MLFSAPVLYLLVAAGAWGVSVWLWRRRQRWLALALTALLLVALNLRAGIKENLSPVNNREEIQPLVAYLEANLQPQDLIYVYYFAVAPFKYYYHGPKPGVCWGAPRGAGLDGGPSPDPQRLWLIAPISRPGISAPVRCQAPGFRLAGGCLLHPGGGGAPAL